VAASAGAAPAPQLVLRALAGGAVPVVSRLPQYEEALREGELGLLFEPRDAITLAAQLERLVGDPALVDDYAQRIEAAHPMLGWSRVADQFEALFDEIAARRHGDGNGPVRRRLRERDFVHVDLHMHTDHSPDCATPVDTLLETAKKVGLGAIAITDHNEVSGALEARERADGIKVIVAEEVKTADQGEVIGLFIEEKIPRGMTLQETIAEIRRQGGLVYVPHPFDRMHAVPDYEHMLDVVSDIDAIEVFNPRVAFSAFNEEAARFAAKYRIVAGAGSDSHVVQGLGSVKIRMHDFDGPEEFLESLRDADIVRKKQSLLYVQALKFIQTRGKK
jgi:predicted metal-dependent phosphoesterase TrpH